MMIAARHPVRDAFSDCSSGTGYDIYYDTKGQAISAFESALADYGFRFNPDDMIDMYGDEGRVHIHIYTDTDDDSGYVGVAILTWYRMDYSGRWEFIGYLT